MTAIDRKMPASALRFVMKATHRLLFHEAIFLREHPHALQWGASRLPEPDASGQRQNDDGKPARERDTPTFAAGLPGVEMAEAR